MDFDVVLQGDSLFEQKFLNLLTIISGKANGDLVAILLVLLDDTSGAIKLLR